MKLIKAGVAGTLESSDVHIQVIPRNDEKVVIQLESVVKKRFGSQIVKLIQKVLEKLSVKGCTVIVNDKGALDFAIVARLESAVYSSANVEKNIAWEEL